MDDEYYKLSRVEQIDKTFPHPWYDGELTQEQMQDLIKLGFKFELEADQLYYYGNDGNTHYEISRNGETRYCFIVPSKEISNLLNEKKRLHKICIGCKFENDFKLIPQIEPCKSCKLY